MVLNDPLANVLSCVLNSERRGKRECLVVPNSKLVRTVLAIMKDEQFLGEAEIISKERGGMLKVNLIGAINKCGAIKPRFSFTKKNSELFEKRFLPAKGFGILIVTTSKGVMTHKEALEKNIGGKLLAYCY